MAVIFPTLKAASSTNLKWAWSGGPFLDSKQKWFRIHRWMSSAGRGLSRLRKKTSKIFTSNLDKSKVPSTTPFAYQSRTNKVFSTLTEAELTRSSLPSARKKLNSHQWSKKSWTTTNNYWSRTHRTATLTPYSKWTSRPLSPDLPRLQNCQRKSRA